MKFILSILSICFVNASDVRVMTYNLLNFSDDDNREMHYITILESVLPDLIVVQEVVGQTGFTHFQSDVLDVFQNGQWSSAPFINQSAQQDIALFFKHDIFSFINTSAIETAQSSGTRDVIEWTMVHNMSQLEFNIYGVHFKASSGSSNADQRLEEATVLRQYLNTLPLEKHFIVAGDFNIYSNSASTEPAFDMLTGESDNNVGRLFDPIDRIGVWHNNSSFSDVHTQSPRVSSFGGGANGGMDDRFDWLFVSANVLDNQTNINYLENSYKTFGNDGNHFNTAINSGSNSSVSQSIANALHDASDHLPVYMDVGFEDFNFSEQNIVITEIMVNPASVSDSYGEWFEVTNITDQVISIQGWKIKDYSLDSHIIQMDNESSLIDPGQYFVLARNGDPSINGGINADYVYDNFSLSNTQDQIILLDSDGATVDAVDYSSNWSFSSGVSMEIHDIDSDNSLVENWFQSTFLFGNGDYGTPGYSYEGDLGFGDHNISPDDFIVYNLFPNPFNHSTMISLFSQNDQTVTFQTFDLYGRELQSKKNIFISSGSTEIKWDGSRYSSGVYFLKISSLSSTFLKKMVLVK